MANDLNLCQFIGRLGQDPDIRYTPQGDAIVNLSIAVGEAWKDKNTNQKQEKTTWPRIVIFGHQATIAAEYLKKGSKIHIMSKYQERKWQDEQGNDHYAHEFVIDNFNGGFQMLDTKNSSDERTSHQAAAYQRQSGGTTKQNQTPQYDESNPPPADYDFDDDIPM